MEIKDKKQRVQILLNESHQSFLARVSKKSGKSVSALLRELVEEKMRASTDAQFKAAAKELRSLYLADKELTEFNILDSEDWYA